MITVPSVPINGKGLVTFLGEVDASTFGLLENVRFMPTRYLEFNTTYKGLLYS